MASQFRIDSANIMHETIDGEVVVVNLENGTYYSLDAVGAELWERLGAGSTLDALVDDVAARYGADRATVAHAVSEFLQHLENEKLVVPVQDGTGADAARVAAVAAAAPRRPYADPVLHKYTDMEELLLVDPIHEVEDSGWPNAR